MFALVLMFLPLNVYSTPILATQILIFYSGAAVGWWRPLHKQSILLSMVATVVILSAARLGSVQPPNYPEIFRLLLIVWTIPIVVFIVRSVSKKKIAAVIGGVLVLQSQWGIAQFIVQRDIGMYLLGESRLGPTINGVAKFALTSDQGSKLIRAYGPYAHANSFSGSLFLGLMALLSVLNKKEHFWLRIVVPIIFLGIFLGFSRATVLALFFYTLVWLKKKADVKMFILPLGLILVVLSPLLFVRSVDPEDQALAARYQGVQWSRALITQSSWWRGSGPGQYAMALREYLTSHSASFQPWQVEPVHSVPLLFMAEWGKAITLLVAAGVILLAFSQFSLEALAILPLLLFDHYAFTQAAPLLWVLVVLAVQVVSITRPERATDAPVWR